MKRRGFSLLELIVALIASTALVASLAATIVITTELLEVEPDYKAKWHDRAIADRVAADLRYATNVDETYSYGFQITKPDPATGNPQTITYESYLNGLTRQVDSGPAVVYDTEAPSDLFQVDGYSAPTMTTSGNVVRLRSSSSVSSPNAVSGININVPAGCKAGDLLLLCVSAKTPATLNISQAGWQAISIQSISNLRLINLVRSYDPALFGTITLSVTPDSAIAAAMVALENVDLTTPITWSSIAGGYAWSFLPDSHPGPLESTGFTPGELNVQIFAADGNPWHAATLGIASFTDAARATGGSGADENSVGIAIRTGQTPSLAITPRLWHQSSGNWLQLGTRLGVTP